jgi:hypothetical protein
MSGSTESGGYCVAHAYVATPDSKTLVLFAMPGFVSLVITHN